MGLTSDLKWYYTLQTTAIFVAVTNPYTYKLMNEYIGKKIKISNEDGCPTTEGFLIHAIVFTLLLRLAMNQ